MHGRGTDRGVHWRSGAVSQSEGRTDRENLSNDHTVGPRWDTGADDNFASHGQGVCS